MLPSPTKKTSPEQYEVILFLIGSGLAAAGIIWLVVGARAREAKAEAAAEMMTRGGWLLGLGVFVFLVLWLGRRIRGG